VKELILVAQDTTAYGSDFSDKTDLVALLKNLASIEKIRWVRLMYAHPAHVTDELIELMAAEEKICRYIDMPLQHISNSILTAMGRMPLREKIEKLIDKMRNRIPDLTLRTAFIVGFPGEDEHQFLELSDFIRQMRFERMGAFVYSHEEGTEAFNIERTVPRSIVEKRYRKLMEIQKGISLQNNRSLEGKTIPVIVDGYDDHQLLFYGRSRGDGLEIDQTVWLKGETVIGGIVDVKIEGSSAYDLVGRIKL
jgi:ribosomal protein S12 methylthiotransferase